MLASPATRAPTPLFLHHKENTKVTATVTKVSLRWRICFFFFMLLFTQYTVKLRALPLSAVAVLLHYLPNMSAFNSHMRQNAVA